MNNSSGYYIMGQHTSVAWCLLESEAIKLATYLNYREGTVYTVVEVKNRR